MSLELRLVEGYVLDPDAIFVGARFDDSIDQQHGIAMRQKGEKPLNVEDFEHLSRCLVHPVLPLTLILALAPYAAPRQVRSPHGGFRTRARFANAGGAC